MSALELSTTSNIMSTLESGSEEKIAYRLSPSHEAPVVAMVICKDKLISASWDKCINVWDLKNKAAPTMSLKLCTHSDHVTCLAVSAGNKIISGSKDCKVFLWSADFSSSEELLFSENSSTQFTNNCVMSLAVANGHVYAGRKDESVQVWDELTLAQKGLIGGYPQNTEDKASDSVNAIRNMARRSVLCLASAEHYLYAGSRHIHVWDVSDIGNSTKEEITQLRGGSDLNALMIHDRKLFSCLAQTTICVWDISNPREITKVAELCGHADYIASLIVTDTQIFGGSYDRVIKVWDQRKLNKGILDRRDDIVRVDAEEIDIAGAHTNCISALAVSDYYLYSSSWDSSIVCQLMPMAANM